MTWEEAELNLRENIVISTKLDLKKNHKVVVSIPPKSCNRVNQEGFRIRVGEKSVIPLPMEMLKNLFEAALQNQGVYNHIVFLNLFPDKLSGKPCYVHAVGKLFVYAGVAELEGKRNYKIL